MYNERKNNYRNYRIDFIYSACPIRRVAICCYGVSISNHRFFELMRMNNVPFNSFPAIVGVVMLWLLLCDEKVLPFAERIP